MTRKEQTGKRPSFLSGWIRENLPDSSTGFTVNDLDHILREERGMFEPVDSKTYALSNFKTKKIMFIEEKLYGAEMTLSQKEAFGLMDETFLYLTARGYKYFGFHCVQFENSSFDDGWVKFDTYIVTEDELIEFLSFQDESIHKIYFLGSRNNG